MTLNPNRPVSIALCDEDTTKIVSYLRRSGNDVTTPEKVRAASVAYRVLGLCNDELSLIEVGSERFPSDSYIASRKEKHISGVAFEPVARKTFCAENDDISRFSARFGGSSCIVTAANDVYFSLLKECLICVHSLNLLRSFSIFVIDCGLSNESKQIICSDFPLVSIVDVSVDKQFWEVFCGGDSRLATILCRAFFKKYLPGFRYVLWIDSDAWIQSEPGVVDLFSLAERQGLAIPEHPFKKRFSRDSHWAKRGSLTDEQIEKVLGHRAVIACCFCFDVESEVYTRFSSLVIQNIKSLGPRWGIDQECLLLCVVEYHLDLLSTEFAFEGELSVSFDAEGFPLFFSTSGVPVSVYHLGGGILMQDRKWVGFKKCTSVCGYTFPDGLSFGNHFLIPRDVSYRDVKMEANSRFMNEIE